MRYIILTILLLVIYSNRSNAEINFIQGFAYHYNEYDMYNDSVFKDNHTSTNSIITAGTDNARIGFLSDSQGDLSLTLFNTQNLSNGPLGSLNLISGLYIIRSEKIWSTSPFLHMFPTLDVSNREFAITPLFGLEYSKPLISNVDFKVLLTPAFTLFGLEMRIF